ncbi:ABC transporter substrate-binding protein [Oceanirhabdus seepicola]|uniref:ABC transporter substrate-binding protein n=1 Tax=Oceanirhabdus seepicola TaxID=2828781 RepID=A0A9J6P729_9CLOT|nr:ABC transporter substrate-binding protein [Oceanirhabdus seepicola]MCM1992403.1 ABC transporter substrate-binding protein [Oceanirhabdus seepicola]
MKKILSMLLVIAMVMTTMVGCGKKKEAAQGVSEKEVKIGTIAAVSGPFAIVGKPLVEGMEAYFNMINEQGGIDGRKIKLVKKDDEFKPELAIQKAEELLDEEVFAIVGQLGTPTCLATLDVFKEAGIPCVYQGTGNSTFASVKGNYFPVQPNYQFEGRLIASYSLNELEGKKIAVLYQDDDMGEDGLKGIESYLKEIGEENAAVVKIPFAIGETDFTSHVLSAKKENPDVTIVYGMQGPTAKILKASKEQGFESQFITSYVNADPKIAELAEGGAEGLIVPAWVNIVDLNDESVKEYYARMKVEGIETPNAFHAAGWVAAQVFIEGLKNTEGELTWDNFIKGMEKIENFNGLAKGVTYTPENRDGVTKMYFIQFIDNKATLLGDGEWVEIKK